MAVQGQVSTADKAASAPQVVPTGKFQHDIIPLVKRIKALEGKGAGVKPFYKELTKLARLDDMGYQDRAEAGLKELTVAVTSQEQFMKDRAAKDAFVASAPSADELAALSRPAAPSKHMRNGLVPPPPPMTWPGIDYSGMSPDVAARINSAAARAAAAAAAASRPQ